VKTRVLVVDDHKIFRESLRALVDSHADMEVVGVAQSGQEAIALTREVLPDVIIMDVKMPVMDGIETTRRILAEMPGIKILALSMYAEDNFVSGMMKAGASGYILKGGDIEELTGAIRKARDSGRS
jgi:two-component system, NarL family, response regulator NreC